MPSYQSLEKKLGLTGDLPVTEDWSAAPDFLDLISDHCLEVKPHNIVECSSGTSSLILSRCCQLNLTGHVFSLENGVQYVAQTKRQLEELSLSEYCDIIHAPLKDIRLDDDYFKWYDLDALPEIEIDMLVIDGPPGFLQKHSRYPALPLLSEKFSEHCIIFLDDAAREDEQELVDLWSKDYPEFEIEYIDNERGCFILKK